MTILLPGLLGLVMFAAFVGFLGIKIAEWPLGIIIASAVAMAAWNLIEEVRDAGKD